MITCQTYTFREEGKRTLTLTLPCFSGTGECSEDFYAAARMNRFYGHAADKIYSYAKSLSDEGVRRMTFICRTDTEFLENGVITVKLSLSLRKLLIRESCPPLTKHLTHKWRAGFLIGKPHITLT